MRNSRFTDSHNMPILKQDNPGTLIPNCIANMASAMPAFISGVH